MSTTAAPTSVRLPTDIDREIRQRARRERRSFTQQVVVLLEAGLGLRNHHPDDGRVDQDEIERLADIARDATRAAGPNAPYPGPVPYPFPSPPDGGGG